MYKIDGDEQGAFILWEANGIQEKVRMGDENWWAVYSQMRHFLNLQMHNLDVLHNIMESKNFTMPQDVGNIYTIQ